MFQTNALRAATALGLCVTISATHRVILAEESAKSLSQHIDDVRANERLYDNLEVKVRKYYKTFYTTAQESDPQFSEVESSEQSIWSVVQDGRFRAELTGASQQFDGRSSAVTAIGMFDGAKTRMFDDNLHAVNEIDGRKKDKHLVSPHMLLLSDMGSGCKGVPLLSTYLDEARVQQDADCRWTAGILPHVAITGSEEVLGRECIKVRVRLIHHGGDAAIWDLWLSPENNFIPLKLEGFTPGISRNIPHSVGVVSEIREVAPGIWFPYASTVTAFDGTDLRNGMQTKRWERKYIVETVSLAPHYQLEFFQRLDIPDGTVVYEVRNDKIVSGLTKGAPNDAAASVKGMRSWGVLIILNVLIACAIGCIWMLRRMSHRR